jgi:hypothetical protein
MPGSPLRIDRVAARAFRIPADAPEADGTIAWDATTMVVVDIAADGVTGLGYTYAAAAAARVVDETLAGLLMGRSPFDIPGLWAEMVRAVRNIRRDGIAMGAKYEVSIAAGERVLLPRAPLPPGHWSSRMDSVAGSRSNRAPAARPFTWPS